MYLVPDPIFLRIGNLEIRWYALCVVTGILSGLFVASKRLENRGLDPDLVLDCAIIGIPFSTLLARLYYVIFNWSYYSANTSDILKIWHGGLAIHGGLIGIAITVYAVCRYRKADILQVLDAFAPCIILGQAIGRWGNYFNMEAYGSVTTLPWAIHVYDAKLGSVMVHPTFLYESIWDLLGFFLLIFVFEKKFKKNDGELICMYMIYYSIGRFMIEGLRTDSLMFFNLKAAQLVSLLMIIAGISIIILLRKKGEKNGTDQDI